MIVSPVEFKTFTLVPIDRIPASLETPAEGVGVLVGVDAQPARTAAVSKPNVKVKVVRGESFNRFPQLDGGSTLVA